MSIAKSSAPLPAIGLLRKPELDQAAEARVTLFSAPPGYLLTESLVAVLVEQNRPILWLRVGPEDRDPATFIISLINAAQQIGLEIGTATLNQMRRSPGPIFGWPPLFNHLAQELSASLPEGSIIVLEHVNRLTSLQPTLGLLGANFLPELPDHLPCILISHDRLPNAALPSYTILKGVEELRIDARAGLALAEKVRVNLSADSIRRAVKLVEGRTGALAGLFSACNVLGSDYIQNTIKRSKNKIQLMAKIARASLTTSDTTYVQALTLALSLNYIHPKIIQSSFGRATIPNGHWLQPLSEGWARVRCIWQEPLSAALHAEVQTNYTALHHTADYLAGQGDVEQAMWLYLKLEDYASAARVIAGIANEYMDLGRWWLLDSWLSQLPANVLQDWPWLLYIQGEIATAGGDLQFARRTFVKSAARFSELHENDGLCQSLLAESALAAVEKDHDHAQSCALAANTIARAAGLEWYRGWAVWQLGRLANLLGSSADTTIYFDQSIQEIKDPLVSGLIQSAGSLSLNQRELRRQGEYHRQAYLHSEQAEQQISNRLDRLLNSPPDNLADLLGVHGWSYTPLTVKLASLQPHARVSEGIGRNRLWRGVLSMFGFYQSWHTPVSGTIGEDPRPWAFPLTVEPSPVDEPPALQLDLQPAQMSLARLELRPTPFAGTLPGSRNIEPTPSVALALAEPPGLEREVPVPVAVSFPPGQTVTAYLLGSFRFAINGQPIEKWSSNRGQALLKYLLVHKGKAVPRDVLMEIFWPEASPEAARNNLNVALHNLRQTIRSFTNDLFNIYDYDKSKGTYSLNPDISLWLDMDEFTRYIQAAYQLEASGQLSLALKEYEVAANLYRGDFLAEDLYEEWTLLIRERLRAAYLDLLDRLSQLYYSLGQYAGCVILCQRILERDDCSEAAHRRLMRCYSRQGQHQLALRQYTACVKALREELNVEPEPATTQLFEQIRRREFV